MNKAYANQVLRLLSRLIQEYQIDPNDTTRFDGDERSILEFARAESAFYGVKYAANSGREPTTGAKPVRTTKGL